jgi:hypothetical protein
MVLMVWSYVVSVNAAQEIIELKNSTYKISIDLYPMLVKDVRPPVHQVYLQNETGFPDHEETTWLIILFDVSGAHLSPLQPPQVAATILVEQKNISLPDQDRLILAGVRQQTMSLTHCHDISVDKCEIDGYPAWFAYPDCPDSDPVYMAGFAVSDTTDVFLTSHKGYWLFKQLCDSIHIQS